MLLTILLVFSVVVVHIRSRHLPPAPPLRLPLKSPYPARIVSSLSSIHAAHQKVTPPILKTQTRDQALDNLTSSKWTDFPTSGFSFTYSAPKSTANSASETKAPADQASSDHWSSDAESFGSYLSSEPFLGTETESENGSKHDLNELGLLCKSYVPLRTVLDLTFDSHVELIRRGIPAHTVTHFYNEALRHMSRNECSCSGYRSRISYACFGTAIFYDGEGHISSQLYYMIGIDRVKSHEHQKFPLYHRLATKQLPKLSSKEKEVVLRAKQHTVQNLVLGEGREAQDGKMKGIVLPESKELLYVDDFEHSKCEQFKSDKIGLPVGHYIAYAIGLALHIRLSNADDEEAAKVLNVATSNAFDLSQCARQGGNANLIPFRLFQDQAEYVEPLLRDAVYPSELVFTSASDVKYLLPKPTNFSIIIHGAYYFFERDIGYLSSIDSQGRPVVIENVGNSVYMRRVTAQIADEVSTGFLLLVYRRSASLLEPGSTQTGDTSISGETIKCPSGWKYIPRVAPVTDVLENCCSVKCQVVEDMVYSYVVQSEMCCKACNYKVCESIPDVTGTNEVVLKSDVSVPVASSGNPSPGITMISI